MNYLSKRISQSFGSVASENSKTKTSPMPILLTGITILVLCFFANSPKVEAQTPTFNFGESNFNIVDNTDGGFLWTSMPLPNQHQYRFTEAGKGKAPGAVFLHHETPLDLSLQFSFSAKIWYDPFRCISSPCNQYEHYWDEGLTFSLLSSSNDTLIGMSGKYLGYAWSNNSDDSLKVKVAATPQHITKSFAVAVIPGGGIAGSVKTPGTISFLQNGSLTTSKSATMLKTFHFWHCLNVIWGGDPKSMLL